MLVSGSLNTIFMKLQDRVVLSVSDVHIKTFKHPVLQSGFMVSAAWWHEGWLVLAGGFKSVCGLIEKNSGIWCDNSA